MYSNVVYAWLWMAMNGFRLSMVDEVPIRTPPPSWPVLPPPQPPADPPPQAAKTSAAAAAASRAAGLCLRSPGRVHVPKCVLVPTSNSRGSSRLGQMGGKVRVQATVVLHTRPLLGSPITG